MAFTPKSLMTVADAAGVVGEAPDGHVRLNGVLYKLPDDCTAEVAKEIVMVQVDTTNLASIHVPQFRLEEHFRIKPKVYVMFQRITWRHCWNYSGERAWMFNEFSNRNSKSTLNVANDDAVVSGKEKLSRQLMKLAAIKVEAVRLGKAKAKAKLGRVAFVKKRPERGPFRSP